MTSFPSIALLLFAAFGAFIHWCILRYGPNIQKGIQELVNEILSDLGFRVLAQMVVFVIVGAVISVTFVEPATKKQAMAAGMAWTTLLGGVATARQRKSKSTNADQII